MPAGRPASVPDICSAAGGKLKMGISSKTMKFGRLKKGPRNLITDVPGIRVGHVTLASGAVQTGATVILPCGDSPFRNKLPAAAHVINGFGKSVGLMQVQELGTLETPIVLTNTFSVSAGIDAVLDRMLPEHPEIGVSTGTVNPVVMECNDGKLNDIRGRVLRAEDILRAFDSAAAEFAEGAVGGGRGMVCYGLKGGIGSSSRLIKIDGKTYTVGALLMTNFGKSGNLTVCGRRIADHTPAQPDVGSVIMVLATDLPLSARQLGRCARRAQNGLARTGSYTGNGSGEIALMFSVANRIPHKCETGVMQGSILHEDKMDAVFEAVADCVEESVISSLIHAETVTGRDGHTVLSLRDKTGISENSDLRD